MQFFYLDPLLLTVNHHWFDRCPRLSAETAVVRLRFRYYKGQQPPIFRSAIFRIARPLKPPCIYKLYIRCSVRYINKEMSQSALKRIELIFQTEVKIHKYPFPGLSHFSVRSPKPLFEFCSTLPNCLQSLNSVDFMRVGRVPRCANNNLKLVYLSILVMAYQ